MKNDKTIEVYPLKFLSIPISKPWGGNSINKLLNRNLANNNASPIGEAWDIVDRIDYQSIVAEGSLKGLTIADLRESYGLKIFGDAFNLNKQFPLIVKIINAEDDLSLQVHPKEKDLKYLPKGAQVKNEVWFILNHEEKAKIFFDLKKEITSKNLYENISNNLWLKEAINQYNSSKNQCFFVEAGILHAIGKGNLILEIQQNSDTTYRVSDWGRVDKITGNYRDLHIKQSLRCINFNKNKKTNNKPIILMDDNKIFRKSILPLNNYFNMFYSIIKGDFYYEVDNKYELLSVLDGIIKVIFNDKQYVIKKGDTYLLPPKNKYLLCSNSSTVSKFITYNNIY